MAVREFLLQRILDDFPFEPTDCQRRLFGMFSDFVCGDGAIMIVNGYAGTGKTEAVGAVVRAMKSCGMRYRLMAPTGRAAKVLSGYTGEKATTIHKQIYRQKSMDAGGGKFVLDLNKDRRTCYFVDEASLITVMSDNSMFGSGNLLEDLIDYIRQGEGNRLVLIGDRAQLPPVSLDTSPALDPDYVGMYAHVDYAELDRVVRQADSSGILFNATQVRQAIVAGDCTQYPHLVTRGFDDVDSIGGGDLIEALDDLAGDGILAFKNFIEGHLADPGVLGDFVQVELLVAVSKELPFGDVQNGFFQSLFFIGHLPSPRKNKLNILFEFIL